MDKLEPCPFCGGIAHDICEPTFVATFAYAVSCKGCGARTRRYDTPAEAIAAWNTRPASPGVAGEAVQVPRAAFDWLMGLGDDFEPKEGQRGAFWWRTEFRRRIALSQPQAKQDQGVREAVARVITDRLVKTNGYPTATFGDACAAEILALPVLQGAQIRGDEPSSVCPDSASPAADEWLRDGNLLYTLADTGQWRNGVPIMANRLTVTIHWDHRYATDEEGEALIRHILAIAQLVAKQSPNSEHPHV